MKALILYKSIHHKNTEKIAKAIAEELNADVYDVDKVKPDIIDNYDIIGFGSGIYFGKHHKSLFKFLDKINKTDKKAFIFSTAGMPFLKNMFHKELRNKLKSKGFEIIGEFSCKGYYTYGISKLFGGFNKNHPNDDDIKKVKEFAKNILKELR
ncbi:flavodoxin family protein [Methanocaldococcus fervens]|uniref:Flavodoxins-like protein n=1 Tax=Methanocaldococcus fervens (strain DSM 4213 / JCM 15782 / AG86) TaxID=573064 RepID=C7P750_METFA|nr:flavodoxin family protein [Methanocaldococcus fervens]ACV24382.1 Flavodoxins-like protein [Methanocaldococcus fervens AG86]